MASLSVTFSNPTAHIPPSVWYIIFRFAAGTSFFPELERSYLEPDVYDEPFGPVADQEEPMREAYDESKETLMVLSSVCKAWEANLRHFRLEWVLVRTRERVLHLVHDVVHDDFLPMRRLEIDSTIICDVNDFDSAVDDLATLVSYCSRLEVLRITAVDLPLTKQETALCHHKLTQALGANLYLQKYEVGLVGPAPTDIIHLLRNCSSLLTLDIAPDGVEASDSDIALASDIQSSSFTSLKSIRLCFDECTTGLLNLLTLAQLPSLSYLWLADYIDPDREPEHPIFLAAIHAFLRAHGGTLRSLVLVSNCYSLPADTWSTVIGFCKQLAEVAVCMPSGHFQPVMYGLPHAALHTVVLNGVKDAMAGGGDEMAFLLSLGSPDFPAMRCVRVDLRQQLEAPPTSPAFRTLLNTYAGRGVVLEDKEGIPYPLDPQ